MHPCSGRIENAAAHTGKNHDFSQNFVEKLFEENVYCQNILPF